jgi:hypothetical protein
MGPVIERAAVQRHLLANLELILIATSDNHIVDLKSHR